MFLIDFILNVDEHLKELIAQYGTFIYGILFLIIFVETGLIIMPFLPGDSLLFVVGAFSASGSLDLSVSFMLLIAAAILGDTVNYWIGSYFGKKVMGRFIKKEYLEKTESFYTKYGKKAIIIARFIPIVRTFAPFVAGVGKMNYPTFALFNVVGGIAWVSIFIFAGYFFGTIPLVEENLTPIIFGIIILSILPGVWHYLKSRKN